MTSFVATKVHIRAVLLFYFNSKIDATKSQRLLAKVYGLNAPSSTTCRQWFRRFKAGDFCLNDKERGGQPKKFTDEELKQLLIKNPTETIDELAKILNVDRSTVGKRLIGMGMVRKAGCWHESKTNSKKKQTRLERESDSSDILNNSIKK